jgi:putative hydrolase of the HAD superfamily
MNQSQTKKDSAAPSSPIPPASTHHTWNGLSTISPFSHRSFERVSHIIFDADDTLWDDQGKLQDAERRMEDLLDRHLGRPSEFQRKFIQIEHRNIPVIGYGFHSYLFSLAQAIFEHSDLATAQESALHIVKELISDFLHQPPRVFQGARETLAELRGRGYSLAVATRGIPGEQLEKVRRSGLEGFFERVFVVPKKEPDTYRNVARELRVTPTACCMVGNSLRSDIKPALEAGFCAIHIPEPTAWSHDLCSPVISEDSIALAAIPNLLAVFQNKNT